MIPELTDGTITLKPFQMEDAEAHLAGEDDEQRRWISGGTSTLESVRDSIQRNQEFWSNGGPVFNFALWAEGQLAGMAEANVDYAKLEGLQKGDANISYGIYPKARGKGYATRAVDLIVEFLKQRGIERAVLRINPENVSSLRIPTKCGFQASGEIMTAEGKMLVFTKELS